MFKRLFSGPAYLLAGALAGAASAVMAVQTFGSNAITSGSSWQSWNVTTSGNAHPYAIAHYLLEGRLPPSAGQLVELSAESDSEGNTIASACDYVLTLEGDRPPRWWSLSAFASDGGDSTSMTMITGDTAIAEAGGAIRVTVSRHPQPGNWIRAPAARRYSLLYSATASTSSGPAGRQPEAAHFDIKRSGC